jgi:hypothetical protein
MYRYLKKRGKSKGEHMKNKLWRKKHHGPLQPKSKQQSKDINPSIRFWVASARE